MDFSLSETQELVRASAAEWLAERSDAGFVRAMADDERGYTDEYWQELAQLGWLGLTIPEQYGGSGMAFADMAVLLRQWGAALAPGPIVESSVVAAAVIDRYASDRAKSDLLPRLASGDLVATTTLSNADADAAHGSDAPAVSASPTSDGWVISGELQHVPYANSAGAILLPARTPDGVALFAVDTEPLSGTITQSAVPMASGAPTSGIEFNEVVCPTDAQIVDPSDATAALQDGRARGAAAVAMLMAGAGRAVADRTLDYVKERRQFGRPIGAFQAIQHYQADIAIKVKSVQHLAHRAAWSIDNLDAADPQLMRNVAQAKWAANTLMPEVCWSAHQSHGAIGFTWEHDLHLYTRRVLSWRADYGDTAQSRSRMAGAIQTVGD